MPRATDRVVVLGPTGSGKTFFIRDLLARVEQIDRKTTNVIVDFKHEWKPRPQDRIARNLSQLERELDRALRDENVGWIIYRVPDRDKLPENAANLDVIAALALHRTYTRIYYDELVYVARATDFATRAPNYYIAVTGGRSKHVPIWGAVQRPAWVPLVALSESDVRASFYLRRRADRATAEDLLGETVPWNVLKRERYSFVMGTDLETTGVQRLSDRSVSKQKEVA